METEKIISTIKEQIGTTDFSDRTIAKYVELNPVEEGKEPDESYFKKGSEFFKSLQGQYNSDFSTKLNAKVDEFKKNYKPTEKPEPQKAEEPKEKDSDNHYQELLDKYAEMEKRLNEKEKAEAQAQYKKNLAEKFKAEIQNKSIKYDSAYYKAIVLEQGEFDTKKDVDQVVSEIIPKYEKMFSDNNRDGAIPFRKEGGVGSSNGGNKNLDSFFERKAEEGMMPKNE